MNLNSRLVLIMVSLLVLAIVALFTLNQFSQTDLVQEIQESSHEISKAVQLSIADLTSDTDVSNLSGYFGSARQKGINEVNIINSEGEIIDSTNPEKIGKIKDLKKLEKGVRNSPHRKETGSVLAQRPFDVVVPVIVGDEHLGYVQVNMLLDNIRTIQHSNFIKRLTVTALIFAVGIAFSIYLSRRYTDPIHNLVQEFKKVSNGDLSVTFPVESRDEIGELARGFNEMVAKLREREVLEKRLYEAEHLSRVGQLASGIAHEIRNPLNYISLAVDHLRTEFLPEQPDKRGEMVDLTDKIREEVRRANYMVVGFMNYGRPLKPRIRLIRYDELLDRTLSVLKEKLSEQKVTVLQQLDPDLPPLPLDPELMRNCILNLVSNGAEAMPDGGEIRLTARFDRHDARFYLGFTDQGCGMMEEEQEKIFQPYFTSKEAGTGLGLAITERIVKAHGGDIFVESLPGKGAAFTISIPMEVRTG